MNKSSILVPIVVAVIAIGVSVVLKPTINVGVSPTPVTVNVPEQKTPVVNVSPVVKTPDVNVNVPKQTLGSVTGPDLFSDYFNQNGVVTYSASRPSMNSASTTLCSFQSPKTGTSTLVFASAEMASSSVAAYKVTFAQSTTFTGSSTPIGADFSYGAGAQSTSVASTTAQLGVTSQSLTFAPATYMNVTLAASDAGLFSPRGFCKAQFKVTGR